MPFTRYRSSFGPETLAVLQAAFDMAWGDLVSRSDLGMEEQTARETLAKRIVDAALEHGERDPERLKRHALAGFIA